MNASATGASWTPTAIEDSTASITIAVKITATQASASGLNLRSGGRESVEQLTEQHEFRFSFCGREPTR